MLAFAYPEGDGQKGANNFASLLVYGLKHLGMIIEGKTGKRLTIIMDNCSGQNKNNVVLRLALWLVEMKFFKEVCFSFYIRGHTKNACDRLFNQMKLNYRKAQVFTMDQLLNKLNEQPNVTVLQSTPHMFLDYSEMMDAFYSKFKGNVTINHVFAVHDSSPTMMLLKADVDSETLRVNFKKRGTGTDAERVDNLQKFVSKQLKAPGVKDIKQVELYNKWRRFVPDPFKDVMCPWPDDEYNNII